MKKLILAIVTLFISVNLVGDCIDKTGYDIALKKAINEYPQMKESTIYDYKILHTSYGAAYMIYFNKTTDSTNADMVLVTMNKNCEILHVTAPTKSTFYLKSKNECISNGTIIGDNHKLSVYICGKKMQFKASNDSLSRNFTKNEIREIRKIFASASSKYFKFSDRQVLYKKKGLKIWVRLYSSSRWFLVFDFVSIAPYPASPEASVWIENNKFNEFVNILKL